jgi:hypothetical protein
MARNPLPKPNMQISVVLAYAHCREMMKSILYVLLLIVPKQDRLFFIPIVSEYFFFVLYIL